VLCIAPVLWRSSSLQHSSFASASPLRLQSASRCHEMHSLFASRVALMLCIAPVLWHSSSLQHSSFASASPLRLQSASRCHEMHSLFVSRVALLLSHSSLAQHSSSHQHSPSLESSSTLGPLKNFPRFCEAVLALVGDQVEVSMRRAALILGLILCMSQAYRRDR
jgi:hypothetical protein